MKANNSKYTMFAKRVATMLVAIMIMGLGNAWAQTTVTSTFTSTALSVGTNEPAWTGTSGSSGSEFTESGRGLQYGATNGVSVVFTCTAFKNKRITAVSAVVSRNKNGHAVSLSATVNGKTLGDGDSTPDNEPTNVPITTSSNKGIDCENGNVVVTISTTGPSSSAKSLYVKSITVTYREVPSEPQTVNFNAHGGVCGVTSLTEDAAGDGIILPEVSASASCAPEGWVFYGWASSAVSTQIITTPAIIGVAGDTYYPLTTTTLHAVYYQETDETTTATFATPTESEVPAELTQISSAKYRPFNAKHTASNVELYIKDYGIYNGKWDIDNSLNDGDGWGYIHSPFNIKSITISYPSDPTKIDHIDKDAGTATLSADKQTIDCSGDVKKVYFYAPSGGESQISSFTVEYYITNYFSNPSCCDKIVELSAGTETNATISSFSPENVPTCGNDASREVTIVADAATGYKFNNGAELSYSGAGTAELVTATNGTAPYTWVYRLSSNATGDGYFSVTSAAAKNYAITLNGNGATTAGTASVNATYNSATLSAAITNPKKTDYIFDGWYSEEGGAGSLIIDKTGALQANVANYTGAEGIWTRDAATTLYAKWSEHSYINFRTNCCTEYDVELASSGVATGGTFAASKYSVCADKEVTLTATPADGYEFTSWNAYKTDDSETTVSVSEDKFNMPAYDVTVDANFDLIEYAITYHLDDGSNNVGNPASYTITSSDILLGDPEKNGYAFLGWYNNSDMAEEHKVTGVAIASGSTGAKEFWANWIEDNERTVTITAPSHGTITVSWNNGANSFTSGSQNIEIGTELTIETAGATGYDAGTITVNGTPLVGSTYTLDSDPLTIAASFSLHNYSITYNLNDGEGATNTTYTYESETITLPTAPTVHKIGYTFQGWFDNSGFEGDAVTTIPNHSTGDKQFWAKWQINNYTLTWTTDGDALTGEYTGKSGKVDFGTAIVAPTTPTKTGYTFAGWSPAVAATMPADNVEYTATWTKNNYHVYFQNNGVTINEYTKEVAYEAQIGALPDGSALAACDGSNKGFKGWTATKIAGTQEDAPDYAESTDVMGAENLYLHAVFAAEDEGPTSSPINVFATTSLGNTDAVTSGYTISTQSEVKAESGYYKDGGSGATKRWVQVKKNNTSAAMIGTTPKTVTVTARLGGGTAKNPLENSVCAIWLDASGNELGDPVVLTNAITAAGGSDFSANLPVANATSAYGVRVYHTKESNYNVNYYSISLSYTVSSIDYSDYMTHCCSLVAVDGLEAVDNTSDTEVTLNWTALSSANQEGVTKLQVVDANNVVKVDNIAADAATATVTGLTKCDTYSFRVATVGASCTTYSEAAEARPFGSAITVTFDNDFEGGAVTSESTTCDENTIALATPDSREGYRFMGWFNGDVEVTADPYTPTATVTLKAHWAQEYTLHYDYNGATGAPVDAKYIAGETVTLPENPTKNYMSPFQEWSYSTAVTVTAGTFPMPESDLTVTAVFGGLQGQWFLVTDESELQANDKAIIAAKEYDYAMSTTQNSNNRGKTGITKKGNVIYSPADAVQIFELETGTVDGSWAFKTLNGTADKYIYAAGSSSNNYLRSEDTKTGNSSFVLDINGGKATAQGTSSNKVMRYNADNNVFACYGSATQKSIALYRFVEGTFNEVTVPAAEDVIGGTIKADQVFVAAGETVTLTYTPKRGYTVGTLTVTGASGSVAVSPAVEAGVTEYTFTMPAEGVTVAATFTALPAVVYNLMEDPSTLIMGQQIVFVGTTAQGDNPRVAGAINNNRLSADAINDGAINTTDKTLSLTDEAAVDYIIEGEPGAYKIMNEGMFLKEATSNKIAWDATGRVWNIAIEDNKTVISTTVGSDTYKFQYNTSGDYFTAYTSDQQPIYIYTLPTETYNLQFQEEDNTVIKTIKVVEGYTYKYTIKNTDVPNVIPTDPQATYVFAGKWSDGTNKYGTGDVVTVSAGTILKPCWKVTPTANKDINTLPTSVTEIVVEDGKTLNVGADRSLDNLTVEAGGKVSGSANLTVNNLTIESEAGKSGQVMDAGNVTVNGDIYMDITFFKGAETLDATTAGRWYMISAPFDVNLSDGFINPVSGQTMTFGQTDGDNIFDLFEYDGYKRGSTGVTGWKRVQGKMKAGTACLIGFNPGQPTTIRLKAASTVGESTSIALTAFPGDATNQNWNGVANPTLHYTNISHDVQTYNNEDGENGRKYLSYSASSTSFVVGTAFFVQETGSITLSAATHGTLRAPKRESERYEACVQIFRQEATEFADQMYVRASETASSEYEQGHDMITWNGTTGTTAMIWAENYGQRLAIEEAPLINGNASYALGLYAPKAGTYRIEATSEDDADLYLTLDGAIIWNLSMGAYELSLNKGTTSGYGLLLQAKAPGVATGVDEIGSEKAGVQKIVLEDKVFILRGGKMYDVTGKAVR